VYEEFHESRKSDVPPLSTGEGSDLCLPLWETHVMLCEYVCMNCCEETRLHHLTRRPFYNKSLNIVLNSIYKKARHEFQHKFAMRSLIARIFSA
jgi:hypothetical protein